MPESAAMYLFGLFTGIALGAAVTFLALRPSDGWADALKGRTKLQQFKDAGIGVAKKD